MSLGTKTTTSLWLTCDGHACTETYGHPDEPAMRGCDPYGTEHEKQLKSDSNRDGWKTVTKDYVELNYCESCSIRLGFVELTPIQQAALMHGKKVVLA